MPFPPICLPLNQGPPTASGENAVPRQRPPAEPPDATSPLRGELPQIVSRILRIRERRRLDKLPILSTPERDTHLLETSLTMSIACCTAFFPSVTIPASAILPYLREAHVAAADTRGILAAVAWGDNFQFDAQTVQRDLAAFHAHGSSIPNLARARRARALPYSFSEERVIRCMGADGNRCPSFPPEDFSRLLRLARVGVEIPRPARFVPSAEPAPLRLRYLEVQGAVHRILHKQVSVGTVLLLPLNTAVSCPGIHLQNAQHWTTKKGKDQGRSLADTSNVPDPVTHCPLNGHSAEEHAEVRSACEAMYGRITHPTLGDLMRMVTAVATVHGWDNVTLWKMDLSGAFNLLWFNPEDVPLLAFPLAAALVAIHLVGLFGWAGMPFAFNVLTRALDALVTAAISGRASWYVDDCCGCSPLPTVAADMLITHRVITELAGDNAVATEKNECGRVLEFIGWLVDLDKRSVTVSPRNLLKITHAFFCFDPAARVSRVHVERMASLASRISLLSRFMRPFTRFLNSALLTFPNNPTVLHRLSAGAQCEVAIWRAFLIIIRVHSPSLSRLISSFQRDAPSLAIRYDASLNTLAVGVYAVDEPTERLLSFVALDLPFPVSNDSSRQNTCEYMAVLLGLTLAAELGRSNFTFALYGDSVSSLAWVTADRVASDVARRANLAMVILSTRLNAHTASTTHVPGVLNTVFDGLSRGKTAVEVGLDPALQVFPSTKDPAVAIIKLCDPAIPLISAAEHLCLAGQLSSLAALLCPTVV